MVSRIPTALIGVMACFQACPAFGIELEGINAFSTEPIISVPVLSICIEDARTLLLGASDGTVLQVTRGGNWLSEILLPSNHPMWIQVRHGLTVASALELMYALGGVPATEIGAGVVLVYTPAGKLLTDVFFYSGFVSLVAVSFDPGLFTDRVKRAEQNPCFERSIDRKEAIRRRNRGSRNE
jgi:hypothetical protein